MENVRLVIKNEEIYSMEIINKKDFLEKDCKSRSLPIFSEYLWFYQDGIMVGKNTSSYDPLILEPKFSDGIYFTYRSSIFDCETYHYWTLVIKRDNRIYQYDEILEGSFEIFLLDNKILLDGQRYLEETKVLFKPNSTINEKEIKRILSLNSLLDCYPGFPYKEDNWENKNLFLEYVLGKDFKEIKNENAFIIHNHPGNDKFFKYSYESLLEEFKKDREECFSKSYEIFYNEKMIILFSNGDIYNNKEYESFDLSFGYEEIIFCVMDESIIEEFEYNGSWEVCDEFHFMFFDIDSDREIKYGWDFIEKLRDNKNEYGNRKFIEYFKEYVEKI